MGTIGILAYGSLLEDLGTKIQPLIDKRINGIKTPFPIEFARSSSSRGGAPTVIPVEEGGSFVIGAILVFKATVSVENATDLLWRRETRNEYTNKNYKRPENPKANQVIIESLSNFYGVETVLYTKIGSNIEDNSPTSLAKLAIKSAREKPGKKCQDGINYLISLKRQNITTPLMEAYEQEILRITKTSSLKEAYIKIRQNSTDILEKT